jgi:hypothetical protein
MVRSKRRSRFMGTGLAVAMTCALLAVLHVFPPRPPAAGCIALGSVFLLGCNADVQSASLPYGPDSIGVRDWLGAPMHK